MAEYIRSLLFILAIGIFGFFFSKSTITGVAMASDDFNRRRKYWLIVTMAGFLSQNFFVFAFIIVVALSIAYRNETKPLAMYFFLLLALPQLKAEIPGFAGVRYLVDIDYVQILSIVLLLPVYLQSRKNGEEKTRIYKYVDKMLISYVALNVILQFVYEGGFGAARAAYTWTADILLPYFAISRGIEKLEDFREILASLLMAGIIVALIAVFEFQKRWLLYVPMQEALALPWGAAYLDRGDYLRTLATSGQPIVLGYVLMTIIGVSLYLKDFVKSKTLYWLGFLLLVAGEITTLSKGPWLGVCLILFVMLMLGKKAASNLMRISLLMLPVVVYILNSTVGENIMKYLPFVGSIDEDNVTYRQKLLDKGLELIAAHPLVGSSDYLLKMEELRQGQGIIDLVNTYLMVALDSGLIGLGLYVGFFLSVLVLINRARVKHVNNEEYKKLGSMLFAVMLAILVVIFSVSPIFHVQIIYMSFAAFGIAFARLTSKIESL